MICLHYWDIKILNKKILIVDCQQSYDLAGIRKCYWSLASIGVFDSQKFSENHFLKVVNYKRCADLLELSGTMKSIKQAGGQLYGDIGTVVFIDPLRFFSEPPSSSADNKASLKYGQAEFANQIASLVIRLGFTVRFFFFEVNFLKNCPNDDRS